MSRAAVRPTRTITVRRPLVRPTDGGRLLRVVRVLLVRRVIVLGLALVVLCLARVWLHLQVVNVGYELSATRRVVSHLEHRRNELRIELATMRAPERLAELAKERLQMVPPERGQVVEMR
jgi:cell division protein FtsL